MAASEREPADPLKLAEALLAAAPQAGFFALAEALERLSPDAVRVGGDGPARAEALRFRHDTSMGFAAGDVASASARQLPTRDAEGMPSMMPRVRYDVTTTFLGLTGSSSPLPLYMPAAIAQNNAGQNVQASFLDIFHHRLLSLFYRLWTRYQYPRELMSDGRDAWSLRLLTLLAPPDGESQHIPWHKLLRLAPLLAPRARTADTLKLALAEILDLPDTHVRIEQWVGGYTPIADEERMRLGHSTATLGRGALLGAQAYERANRFRLHLGPLDAAAYAAYMRRDGEHDGFERVREVVTRMVREPLDYDIVLLLSDDALAGFPLTSARGHAAPITSTTPSVFKLGENTRLRARSGEQTVVLRNAGERKPNPAPTANL